MDGFALTLASLAVIASVAYYRLPFWAWVPGIAVLLAALQALGWAGKGIWVLWLLYLLIAIPRVVYPLRYRLVSAPLFTWFKSVLPQMSQTEKEAIEAGDVGWEKDIFQGAIHWSKLLSAPTPRLTAEEQIFIDTQVENLCASLDDWQIQVAQDLPPAIWDTLKTQKFLGMIIPKEYGGLGFSVYAHSCVITKIATRSINAAVTAMVPNSLGPAELLLHYGTTQQKEYYLPRLATGTEIPCFALTGPEAGSDAGAMPDKGIVCKSMWEGKETLGIRLSFDKRYITLAPIATLIGVAFKLFDPEQLLGEKTELGITLCLIPRTHPGIEIGARHAPMQLAFMNGPIRATDIFIPLDWIIGGVERAGQGWRMLMECLSAGRGISLPALSTATGIMATRMTGAYASIRRQFNVPIASFEGIEEALARITGYTYLLQATRHMLVAAIDKSIAEQKGGPSVATAIGKYHMTEMARKIINDAMDIHGGRGIMMGPLNYLGRAYQAMPVSITVEGANILTRSLMIFGQGAMRCHPYVLKEMQATDIAAFDKQYMQHTGYILSRMVRCGLLALTRGHASIVPKSSLASYMKKINWLSTGLAIITEVAMLSLGAQLKRKEKISARLGDILSQLYIATAVIKYYQDNTQTPEENLSAQWALQTCLYEAQEAFYGLFENFPQKYVGCLLKCFIFPWGRAFTRPQDSLTHNMVKSILTTSTFRENLTHLGYYGKSSDDPSGLIEIAFGQCIRVQAVLDKIQVAVKNQMLPKNSSFTQQCQLALEKKILTEQEVLQLQEFDKIRKKVIAVDEFPFNHA